MRVTAGLFVDIVSQAYRPPGRGIPVTATHRPRSCDLPHFGHHLAAFEPDQPPDLYAVVRRWRGVTRALLTLVRATLLAGPVRGSEPCEAPFGGMMKLGPETVRLFEAPDLYKL